MPVETELQAPAIIRAPRGNSITCKGWHQEAAMRMLMNNLDPDVAEKPEELIVYGGRGKRCCARRSGFPAVAPFRRPVVRSGSGR